MNELLIDIIFGVIIVIIIAFMISKIDYNKNSRMPKIIYVYDKCEECNKVRIHKILLHSGKKLSSDCLACSLGKEKYDIIDGILIEHIELENKRFKEMLSSWSKEEGDDERRK